MRSDKPKCGRCRHPGFRALSYHESRPVKLVFQCDKCQSTWSCGRLGNNFVDFAMNKEEAREYRKIYLEINKDLGILK